MTDSPQPPVPEAGPNPPKAGRRAEPTQFALGALVFVATFVLLLGLASIWTSRDAGGATTSTAPAGGPSAASAAISPPPDASPSTTAGSGSSSPSPPPPSTSPASPEAVLVGAGDIGDCSTDEDSATAALIDEIDGTVFTAGDNAYENGSTRDFATCYDATWGRHKERTRPAPGNHDWYTSDLAGYFDYFGDAARGPDGHSWYSYDLGTWHVIVLDSECAKVGGCEADSRQGRWLASDLAESRARCTVAIWHKPRFSSGFHGNDGSVGPFWTALYQAGVDVVINGHDHDYERFAPQDPDGDEDRERGLRQFVVGTGGTPLRRFSDPVANSELRSANTHGVFQMSLRDGQYDWEFVPVSGDFSDRGTAFCH